MNNDENRTDCQPLMDLATPDLYRRNLFRVLGLTVDATPKDAQRRMTRRKMEEKLGKSQGSMLQSCLALDPIPTEEDVRAAMERLCTPKERLLDELFWFWPSAIPGSTDEAHLALERGDSDQAARIWMQLADSPEWKTAARHNLAVLSHLQAVDWEVKSAVGKVTQQERQRVTELWSLVYARWQETIEDEAMWTFLKTRVQFHNDAQLTTGLVRRIQNTLPQALLMISARLACAAAERSDHPEALRHLSILRGSNLGEGSADEAIRQSLQPVRIQLKTVIDGARRRWITTPQKANQTVRDLFEQGRRLMGLVDAMLPETDPTRVGLHDLIAEAMLDGQITFGGKTNEWLECVKLLQLAQQIAASSEMQGKLSENVEVLNKNHKQGNDWCSPGYWDLPPESIAILEEAREKGRSGNYEGTLADIVGLEATLGKPLIRCIAFTLSQLGWKIYAAALDDFASKPTSQLQRFLDVIHRKGSISIPNPQMQSWMLPDCPICDRSSYTQWINGEYDGQKFWMCSTCGSKHDNERDAKKRVLAEKISEGLDYLKVAEELDKNDSDIKDSIQRLQKTGKDFGMGSPNPGALKKRLGTTQISKASHTFDSADCDRHCFFCGGGSPDEECRIGVPICGEVVATRTVFGKGIKYRFGELPIPRCRRCWTEHREWPARIEHWRDLRVAAGHEGIFPEAVDQLQAATRRLKTAEATRVEAEKRLTESKQALETAKSIGAKCDRCQSASVWKRNLCRTCDGELFALGLGAKFGIGGGIVLASAAAIALNSHFAELPALFSLSLPVIGGVAPYFGLTRNQVRRRDELAQQRDQETKQRRAAAIEAATKTHGAATEAVAAAIKEVGNALQAKQQAETQLAALKDEATAAFDQGNPEPTLAGGVKPESDFIQFDSLLNLRNNGWGFGHEINAEGHVKAPQPVNLRGIVNRTPRQGKFKPSARNVESVKCIECVDEKAPGPWSTKETVICEITSPGDVSISADESGDQVAYATTESDNTVFIQGTEIGTYEKVYGSIDLSPDGQHFHFTETRTGCEVVIQDGRPWKPYEDPGYPLVVGDWLHVYSVVKNQGKQRLVVDGQEGPVFDEITSENVSEDNGQLRTWYLARNGKKWMAVVDGVTQQEYDECRHLWRSVSDGTVHYWASKDGKWFRVDDNRKGPLVDDVLAQVFYHDRDHDAAVICRGQQCFLVVNGAETPLAGSVKSAVLRFVEDHDSMVNLLLERNDGFYVVTADQEHRVEGQVSRLAFSPNGSRYGCLAKRGETTHVIIDGVSQASNKNFEYCDFTFSADSIHVAWVATEKTGEYGRHYHLSQDGAILATSPGYLFGGVFHPEFSATLAYRSNRYGGISDSRYILDGQDLGAYDQTFHTIFDGFQKDGSLSYYARRGRQLLRVRHQYQCTTKS